MLTEVAQGVLVHQSPLLRNNTAVVRGSDGALLVDPGITIAEMTCLAVDLDHLGTTVVAGFATHPDWDHVLWNPDLGDAPRYGTAGCAQVLHELRSDPAWRDRVAEGLPPEVADETPLDLLGLVTALPAGAARIPWAGPSVRLVEHPAHATGHAALVVEDARVLVAGDMLSDVLVPMLGDDGDVVQDYLIGLRRLEETADDVDVVVPGHGSVCDAAGLRARLALDRAYVLALRDGRTPDDPRIDGRAEPGWEWVADVHRFQVERVGRGRRDVDGA